MDIVSKHSNIEQEELEEQANNDFADMQTRYMDDTNIEREEPSDEKKIT